MKERQKKLVILGIIIAFLVLILLIVWFCLQFLKMKDRTETIAETSSITPETSTADILENNKVEVIEEDDNKIYVVFAEDLYDEEGNSNKEYFEKVIDEINVLKPRSDYYLIDEEKEIRVHVIVRGNGTYDYEINDLSDYYDRVDGDTYAEVQNSELRKSTGPSNFSDANEFLFQLDVGNTYFSAIKDMLGEGRDLENGYTSYKDGAVLIRISPIKTVRNIIFTNLYTDYISNKVKVGTDLEDIKEFYPDNSFGGLSEKYLGYVTKDYYYFFYPDEISIYSYEYSEDGVDRFEDILKKYLEDNDLGAFVNRISASYAVYDSLEYDEAMQDADIMMANRGIEIKIRGNDPKGITLYNNYYFTEEIKDLVKEGKISYVNKDLLNIYEKERRNSR